MKLVRIRFQETVARAVGLKKSDPVDAARIHPPRFLHIPPPSQRIPLGVSCREVCGNIPAGRQL